MGGELIKVIQVVVGTQAGSKRCFPEGNIVQEICYGRCEKESLSHHNNVYEVVGGLRYGGGQGCVGPNDAGVGVEEGAGMMQVIVQ